MARNRITDHDRGYKRLAQRIARAVGGVHVDVGIIGDDANRPHTAFLSAEDKHERKALNALSKRGGFLTAGQQRRKTALNNRAKASLTIGEIGEIHEFGLGNNPVRSWLRGYVDENKAQILQKVHRVAYAVELGKLTAEEGMNQLGLSIVGGIRKRIATGIAPPVTAATQARKGAGKTTALINTGQFRSSITHKVETGA